MKLKQLIIGSILAMGASAQALTPVQAYGRVKAKGGALYESTGSKKVVLRGMSFFWSSEPNGYNFYHPETIAWLQSDWLASIVRIPLAPIKTSSTGIDLTNPSDSAIVMNQVLTAINGAIAQGIYVIVDWHTIDAMPSSDSRDGHTTQAVKVFSMLAAKFKHVPNIIWEVWNEPTTDMGTVVIHANTVIKAIRAQGNGNLAIVGSPNWSSEPNDSPSAADDSSNVAYTLHFYANSHSPTGTYYSNMKAAISAGRTVFVTEWGTTNADGNSGYNWGASSTWLSELDAAGVSSCNWNIGNQLSDPNNKASAVQGSAALNKGAPLTGNWTSSNLTTGGAAVRNYLRTANAGLFTLPDTALHMVVPLTDSPSTAFLSSATKLSPVHITATFNKSISWVLNIVGRTSKASSTYSGTGTSVDVSWVSTTKKIGPAFVAETVDLSFTGISTTGSMATLVLKSDPTSIQSPQSHRTAFAWSAQGLRLPTGVANSGTEYSVRVMDLRGHQIGATRSSLARDTHGETVLDLAPPSLGSGVAFVELEGPDGQRSQVLLPPVH